MIELLGRGKDKTLVYKAAFIGSLVLTLIYGGLTNSI